MFKRNGLIYVNSIQSIILDHCLHLIEFPSHSQHVICTPNVKCLPSTSIVCDHLLDLFTLQELLNLVRIKNEHLRVQLLALPLQEESLMVV